jgi:hypothetical protein
MRMKTYEEYRATAMLLGMGYSHTTHAFYPTLLGVKNYGEGVFWLDADTLEPLDQETRIARRTAFREWALTRGGNDAPITTDENS